MARQTGLFQDQVYENILRGRLSGPCVYEIPGESRLRDAVRYVAVDHGSSTRELILVERGEDAEERRSRVYHRRFEAPDPLKGEEFSESTPWALLTVQGRSPCVAKAHKDFGFSYENTTTQCHAVRVRLVSTVPDPVPVPVNKVEHLKGKLIVTLAGNSPAKTSEHDFIVTLMGHSKVDGTYCVSNRTGNNAFVIRFTAPNVSFGTLYDSSVQQGGPPVSLTFGHVIDPSITLYHVFCGDELPLSKPGREIMDRGSTFHQSNNQFGRVQYQGEYSQARQEQHGSSQMNGLGLGAVPQQNIPRNVWNEAPGQHSIQMSPSSHFPPGEGSVMGSLASPADSHSQSAMHLNGSNVHGMHGYKGAFGGVTHEGNAIGQGWPQRSMDINGKAPQWGSTPPIHVSAQGGSLQGETKGQGSGNSPYDGHESDEAGFASNVSGATGFQQRNAVDPTPQWVYSEMNHQAPSSGSQSCSGGGGGGGRSDHQSNASGGRGFPADVPARQDPNARSSDVQNSTWRGGQGSSENYQHQNSMHGVGQGKSVSTDAAPPPAPVPANYQDAHAMYSQVGSSNLTGPSLSMPMYSQMNSKWQGGGQSNAGSQSVAAPLAGVCQPAMPQQANVDPNKTLKWSDSEIIRMIQAVAHFSGSPFTQALFDKLCPGTPESIAFIKALLVNGHGSAILRTLGNEPDCMAHSHSDAQKPPSKNESDHSLQNQASSPFVSKEPPRIPSRQSFSPVQGSKPQQMFNDRSSQAGSDPISSHSRNPAPFSFDDLIKPAASDPPSQSSVIHAPASGGQMGQVQQPSASKQNAVGGRLHGGMPRQAISPKMKTEGQQGEMSGCGHHQHTGGHPSQNPRGGISMGQTQSIPIQCNSTQHGGGHVQYQHPSSLPSQTPGGGVSGSGANLMHPHAQGLRSNQPMPHSHWGQMDGRWDPPGNPGSAGVGYSGGIKGDIPAQDLRGYQRDAVDRVMSTGQNYLVTAPTGSGKTRMFVEATRCESDTHNS